MTRGADRSPQDLPAGLEIRTERTPDYPSVSALVAAAFGSPTVATLVEAIRASAQFVPELSLVATIADHVIGHVMISYATIRDDAFEQRIAMLSPLAVAQGVRNRGVGSALVRRVTALADECGEPLVVLEGSPAFYGRLGFEYSVRYGIHITLPSWAPAEAAQVLRLRNYKASIRGQVVYPPAFHDVTGE